MDRQKHLFDEMKRLFDESEKAFCDAFDILVILWKESKDSRIEEFFRRHGGARIEGEDLFMREKPKQ